jgi:hypothetical protein
METKKIIKENNIIFRVLNQDKIKYNNLAKAKKTTLSKLIRELLNNELNK